ncbi:MAG: histidine kinase dimerization/phosphoacceptor domain-containing protein, partial [Microbacterium sp.]
MTDADAGLRRPAWIVVAWIVVACAALPAVAAVLLAIAHGLDWSPLLRAVFTAVVYSPVAAIAVLRGRWAVAACTGALSVSAGAIVLLDVLLTLRGPGSWLDAAVAAAAVVLQAGSTATLVVMPWLFVRHPVRRAGIAVGLAIVVAWTVMALQPMTDGAYRLQNLVNMTAFLVAGLVLAAQWRRGTDSERETLAWFAIAAVLVPISFLNVLGPGAMQVIGDAAFVLELGFLPTAVVAATVGGSARAVDGRLVGGVVWTQSLAIGSSLYLIADAVLRLLGAPAGISGGIAAAALALGFSSVLTVMKRRTARVFFGPGTDVRAVLRGVGERIDADEGLQGIAESLREIWRLDAVQILPVRGEGDGHPGHRREGVPGRASGAGSGGAGPAWAEAGHDRIRPASAGVLERELTTGRRTVGVIRCRSADAELLRGGVAPMIDRIGSLLAAAVLLAAANEELAAARERTLRVRSRERAMLHRELHDDLVPALAGIGFGMAGAGRMLDAGDPVSADVVERLREELGERAEDVRRLARALLPVALDAGDLDGAIRELAGRFRGVDVAVRAPGADELDGPTQISVFLLLTDLFEAALAAAGPSRLAVELESGAT